ncbi:D-hexose-6-phosphate mutarotase [Acidobacteria bacterium AB60]|nr:D-hexose-6-phosphate mutarotase [Acidobacteria bacterium AB60]
MSVSGVRDLADGGGAGSRTATGRCAGPAIARDRDREVCGDWARIGDRMETLSHIDKLNARFGIAGVAQVTAGKGGFPVVRVTSSAATGEVSLYGAQVMRWKPAGGEEVLFLSEKSFWEAGRPIRGGIPVCFPWFADKADDPKAPKHGYVRTREWRLDSLSALDDGSVTLVCITENDGGTRALWPHEYCVAYRITLGLKLRLELTVINRGKSPMRFEEALHSYLRIGNVEAVTIAGLDGLSYLDKTDGFREKQQSGEIRITEQTDRIYLNAHGAVEVEDGGLRRRVRTEKVNSATTVVWNPWSEQTAKFADMGGEEWRQMVCVEASNVQAAAIQLDPGEEHTMRVTLSTGGQG